jgi:rhamnosyltransferase
MLSLHAPAPNRDNTCAAIVTYFPNADFEQVLERIRCYFARVIVVDNSDHTTADRLGTILRAVDPRIIFLPQHENTGVATALNTAIAAANHQGFYWVVTFDQDTELLVDIVPLYAEAFLRTTGGGRVAVIGCNYHRPVDTDKPDPEPTVLKSADSHQSEAVITSGMCISVSAHDAVGGFDDDLFIDLVDFDFCLRMRCRGFLVLQLSAKLLLHPVGTETVHRIPWSGRIVTTTNHSPRRRYFLARNTMVLARRYWRTDRSWVWEKLRDLLRKTAYFLMFENRSLYKLIATCRGLYDGLTFRDTIRR